MLLLSRVLSLLAAASNRYAIIADKLFGFMRIEYVLFAIYILLSFWLIPKITFIKQAGLTIRETRLLLSFKIFSGIAGAFYFSKIATNSDYISFNEGGKIEYRQLLSNPGRFFTDFGYDISANGLGGLFDTKNSFWGDLRFNLLNKFIAVLDLLTKENFYFNSIVFCTILFFGHIAFYKIYSEIYKGNKINILLACFCLPSMLLYTSCIHKDGIIFLSVAMISYIFHRILLSTDIARLKYLLQLLFFTGIIFLFRNYVVVALVPAMATALLYKLLPEKKIVGVLLAYGFFIILFFLSAQISPSVNLPAAVVQRKAAFAELGRANTNIHMNDLYPTIQSFITNLPQAANHYLLRPYLLEFRQPAVFLTALELLVYQMILIAYIFFKKKKRLAINSFNVFGSLLFINMVLIVGYTIPNVGAIVRYRSIFWVFLICPLICNIARKKLLFFRRRGCV